MNIFITYVLKHFSKCIQVLLLNQKEVVLCTAQPHWQVPQYPSLVQGACEMAILMESPGHIYLPYSSHGYFTRDKKENIVIKIFFLP